MDTHIRLGSLTTLIWFMLVPDATLVDVVCKVRDEDKAVCSYYGSNASAPVMFQFPGKHIPKPDKIQSIDISGNQYISADFSEFISLRQLHARNVIFLHLKDEENFKLGVEILKNLEELDLSGSKLTSNLKFKIDWPPQLIKLTLANMDLNEIFGLEKLQQLEELDFSSNNLQTLPKLNKSSSIVTINLNTNPIDDIAVEQVAPMCQLNSFFIEIKQPGSFNTEPKYHRCQLLDHWFTKYGIASGSFSCGRIPAGYQETNYEFSEEAMKARNDCLNALPATSVFELLLFAMFFSFLFPVLYFASEAYNRYESRKQASRSAGTKHEQHRGRTLPPDVDVESNHSDVAPDPEQEEHEV